FRSVFEQMRRVWRRDSLSCEMPANVQVGRIFSLFDDLMMLLRFANCVLLRLNVVGKSFVAALVIAADLGDIFLDRREFFFGGCEFLLRQSRRVRAAEPRPNKLGPLVR